MVLTTRRSALAALTGAGVAAIATATATGSPALADEPVGQLVTNAREAGATGDGTTDDAPALNAAVVALAKLGGGVLQLPRGTYLLRAPLVLRSGVTITGAVAGHGYLAGGRASAVALVAAADLQGAVIDTPSDDAAVAAGVTGVDIRGNGRCTGIRLRNATWCVVSRCSIVSCGGQGVLLERGMACVLEDLLVTDCLQSATRADRAGVVDVGGTDHYLHRCEASGSLRRPSDDGAEVVAVAVRGANHFVSDCVGEYADLGWEISADGCRFTGVRGDTNFGEGFVVTGGANAFSACSAVGNSQAGSGTADAWVLRGGGNTLAACNVVTSSSKQVRHGFADSVNTSAASARNTYTGCTVDASTAAPWSTEGFLGSSPAIAPHAVRPADGTRVIDVAQASLVVLFDYRSPTVVTGFSRGVGGQTIRVLGGPLVTIAPSASISTALGLPLVLTKGRAAVFTLYDGTWYQDA
jgi:hypothetical protein